MQKAKMQIFTTCSKWFQRWLSLNMCLLGMHTANRDGFYVFNFWCMLPKTICARGCTCFKRHCVSELEKKVRSLGTCLSVPINNVDLTTSIVLFFFFSTSSNMGVSVSFFTANNHPTTTVMEVRETPFCNSLIPGALLQTLMQNKHAWQ